MNISKRIALYQSRIKKGVRWLDKNKRGWRKLIDVTQLDLGDSDRCILGQAFDNYWDEVVQDRETPNKNELRVKEAIALGFALEDSKSNPRHYDLLSYLWFEQLTK